MLPTNMQREFFGKLQSTNLSDARMKRLSNEKIWLKGMPEDIKDVYKGCKE